ncbi:MAG: redoxin domain-containing protein [Chloroflexi bacterium]|nr:redoxin domain-containing protein [Chloroflexota bacterium]
MIRLQHILSVLAVLTLVACAGPTPIPDAPQAALPAEATEGENEPSPIPSEAAALANRYEDMGPAPELHDGPWLNSDEALKLADLRGQVVLLEMWTFGCINCIRTIPTVNQWYETYADHGLVIIGNHYPEFSYERSLENLQDALVDLEIQYPVIQDNDRETWGAYNNRFWPTIYLIDKWGHIRYVHIGEGRYDQTEAAIVALLAEPYPN